MRKLLIVLACCGLFAAVANANNLHLFLGTPQFVGDGAEVDPDAFVADTGAFESPVVLGDCGTMEPITLGLWGTVDVDFDQGIVDVWNGIAVDFATTGCVEVLDSEMNNQDHNTGFGTAFRWEDNSDFGDAAGFFLIAVSRFGLGGLLPAGDPFGGSPPDAYSYWDGMNLNYWLGNITVQCGEGDEGGLFLCVGDGGIARQGGDVETDLVFFGPNDGVRGDAFGVCPPLPLAVCIPEPASLLLLGLAGLFLRRR